MTPNHLQQAIARATAAGDEVMVGLLQRASQDYYPGAAEINQLVGNLWNSGWGAADKQIGIIESEFHETANDGIAARDVYELRDGVGDLIFTTLGLAHRTGLNAAADYAQVVASQYSKFDPTEEDALKTKAKYDALGMATRYERRQIPGTDDWVYVTFSAKDQIDGEGRKCGAGKWLKSYRFAEPVFDELPAEVGSKLYVATVDTANPA
ncbi:hypothetical protein [Pseudomonas putida]|uniref:Uncharacterized protein n=1 Tax=Pseudomonas putida TaxID=303 RepID=A0A1L7NMP7_PSEPU|nr:hypothetical protein [Pseudomonas putida]BAW26749.1 Uncharacterized protein KF715C_pA2440 [Pseudomonas putida]